MHFQGAAKISVLDPSISHNLNKKYLEISRRIAECLEI